MTTELIIQICWGLNRELAYIRNGIVASNAADFNIPVSSDLDSVHFLWNNPDPTLPVSYKLVIKIDAGTDPEVGADDATEAMHQPFVNISHSGRVTCCVQSLKKDPVFNIPQWNCLCTASASWINPHIVWMCLCLFIKYVNAHSYA